jgi:hypothetical protein
MENNYCQHCGIKAPTKYVDFRQNIGMLFARRSMSCQRYLCRPCIGRYFWAYTMTTLVFGWWGLISFCVTPMFLLNNILYYVRALRLPSPNALELGAAGSFYAVPPLKGTVSSKPLQLLLGAAAALSVLTAIAYYNVDFLERTAPSVNAALHQGEISDDVDAQYVTTKIYKDLVGLGPILSDASAKVPWDEYRSKILAKQPYLEDLDKENGVWQRRMQVEQNANLGANDACERIALTEYSPALNDWVQTWDGTFALLKNSPVETQEVDSALNKLSRRKADAQQRIETYFKHNRSDDCPQ